MQKIIVGVIAITAAMLSGCTRIETGEVGLRVNFNKTISSEELSPGFNQVLLGSVITFKIRDVAVSADNLRIVASDNSTMKDFDVTAIYSIAPTAVSDLWTTKNRAFHSMDGNDVLLMNKYVEQILSNAAYKSTRPFEALTMGDNRSDIEAGIKTHMIQALTEENLNAKITISKIQIRSIIPADSITQSANDLVRAKNELSKKTIEVQTAVKEAERVNALNSNPKAIEYMNAQANMNITQAVLAGKVQTIVVPYDFKGIINAGK